MRREKRKLLRRFFLSTLTIFSLSTPAFAQNWELVWSDEFTNGISSDWVYDIGTGSGGWGNNELQYYRQENATVENGHLVITARQENFGGRNYTSARMKTQGRQSFRYGRIEAGIAIPVGSGLWPAFWSLGSNFDSVGWPHCGEIDIMEHVNTETSIHGTIHWQDHNNQYANYGGSTTVSNPGGFHVYAVEWDESAIRWFIDGNQYHEASIANGVNGTNEFHQGFFLILNLAVGGNWPGNNIDLSRLPAQMRVDYVRVYRSADGSGSSSSSSSTSSSSSGGGLDVTVEAENYSDMSGVQTENTTDTGGGVNVGWIDDGDWMAYSGINIPTSGNYTVEYRIASQSTGGQLSLDLNAGSVVLGVADIPVTGGWQNWTTVSQSVYLDAGTYDFGIYANTGGWNLNWFRIHSNGGTGSSSSSSSGSSSSGAGFTQTVQAEAFTNMSGVQTENTSDTGGGANVGWIDSGDWMAYAGVTVPVSGAYLVEYRVASQSGSGVLSLDLNGGATVLGSLNIPATGGWQNWTTISHTVFLNQGTHDFGIYASAGGWNLNWWRITLID